MMGGDSLNIKARLEKLESKSGKMVSSRFLQRLHIGCENLPDRIPAAQFKKLFSEMWVEDSNADQKAD